MKQINIVLPAWQSSWGLEDVIAAIRYSYFKTDSNVHFSMSTSIKNNSVNFIFEEFTRVNPRELISFFKTKNQNTKIILVLSEFVTGNSFNNFSTSYGFKKLLIENSNNSRYLRKRFTSLKNVIKNFTFDGFLVLHPAIEKGFKQLCVGSMNEKIPFLIFTPILPVNQILQSNEITLPRNNQLNIENFDEKTYMGFYPEVSNLWNGSLYEHFLRYGIHENRLAFNFIDKELPFPSKFDLLMSLSSKKTVSEVKLVSMGSTNGYRLAWARTISCANRDLKDLGFEFNVDFQSGWDTFSYKLQDLLEDLEPSLFSSNRIDVVVPISEDWPYISPIRIWRSFACGLLPIRVGGKIDTETPLKHLIEQVNSYYPVYSLFWASELTEYKSILLNKIISYNDTAACDNKKTLEFFF